MGLFGGAAYGRTMQLEEEVNKLIAKNKKQDEKIADIERFIINLSRDVDDIKKKVEYELHHADCPNRSCNVHKTGNRRTRLLWFRTLLY